MFLLFFLTTIAKIFSITKSHDFISLFWLASSSWDNRRSSGLWGKGRNSSLLPLIWTGRWKLFILGQVIYTGTGRIVSFPILVFICTPTRGISIVTARIASGLEVHEWMNILTHLADTRLGKVVTMPDWNSWSGSPNTSGEECYSCLLPIRKAYIQLSL